nr:TRAP transporter small permease [Marinobacterium ramblicola]
MLTLIDVVGRYLFATPVTGAFEVTELMLASVIFLGLPLVTSERNHIAVDIIDAFLSSRSVSRLKIIASLVGAFCFTLFAWMLWHHAFNLLRYGDTTAVLQIPYSWLSFLMAVAASLSALALCLIVIGDLADHLQSDEEK